MGILLIFRPIFYHSPDFFGPGKAGLCLAFFGGILNKPILLLPIQMAITEIEVIDANPEPLVDRFQIRIATQIVIARSEETKQSVKYEEIASLCSQ